MANAIWYVGRCIKRLTHDIAGKVELMGSLEDSGPLIALTFPNKLFGKTSEVEIKGSLARNIRPGEWVRLQISGRRPSGFWQGAELRRLYHFVDLREAGGLPEIQRILTVDGIEAKAQSGLWAIRHCNEKLLIADLKETNGRAKLASLNGLEVMKFHNDGVSSLKLPDREWLFYEIEDGMQTLEILDWTPDNEFISRVLRGNRSLNSASANLITKALDEVGSNGALRQIEGVDLHAAHDALRSGRLAKRLQSDADLLREFVESAALDRSIANVISQSRKRLEDEIEVSIRAELSIQLNRQIEEERVTKLKQLQIDLSKMRTNMQRELEIEIGDAQNRMRSDLANQLLEGEGENARRLQAVIEQTDSMRLELEVLIQEARERTHELEERKAELARLNDACNVLHEKENELSARVEAAKLRDLELKGKESIEDNLLFNTLSVSEARTISRQELAAKIGEFPLLTDAGRIKMLQFLALMLAGEVPVLAGPDAEQFLLIAEVLVSNGLSHRMQADPTVIVFEDLFVRPGTKLQTSIATSNALAKQGHAILTVISGAESSGVRFWLPTLCRMKRTGQLPRPLLLCLTCEDEDSEEAAHLWKHGVHISTEGTIDPDAAGLALVLLSGTQNYRLDPGECSENPMKGARIVAKIEKKIELTNAIRIASLAAEMSVFAEHKAFISLPASAVSLL